MNFVDGHTANIVINNQNYNLDSLALTIKNVVNYSSFNMTFDYNVNKYVFTASQNFNFGAGSSMQYLLGIEPGVLFDSTHTHGQYIANFLVFPLLFVQISGFNNPNISSNSAFPISFIIANTTSLNEMIFYENYQYDNVISISSPQYINNFKIRIVDENGKLFQNNGLGIQLVFEFL